MNEELKLAEKSLELVKDFLQKIINPPPEELGLLFADNIKYWRFKNQLRIIQKAQKFTKDNDVHLQQISLKFLIPMLDYASLEEDEYLQNKWAKLLANSVDSSKQFNNSVFPYILSQISSNEAKCLFHMRKEKSFDVDEFAEIFKKYELSWPIVFNLKRLGLIQTQDDLLLSPGEWDEDGIYFQSVDFNGYSKFELTELGISFVNACT